MKNVLLTITYAAAFAAPGIILAGHPASAQAPLSGQVPLSGKIPYSSDPAPDGGRQWVSVGWKVRLLHESGGWACTISGGPMVGLVPNDKLRHDIPWQGQSYTYGALFRVGIDATELYAWHKGPAAPEHPALLNVTANLKQAGQLHLPIVQQYVSQGILTMKASVARDVLLNVIFPYIQDNESFGLNIDQTAYGLGAVNFRMSAGQFAECLQWMDKYNRETQMTTQKGK